MRLPIPILDWLESQSWVMSSFRRIGGGGVGGGVWVAGWDCVCGGGTGIWGGCCGGDGDGWFGSGGGGTLHYRTLTLVYKLSLVVCYSCLRSYPHVQGSLFWSIVLAMAWYTWSSQPYRCHWTNALSVTMSCSTPATA